MIENLNKLSFSNYGKILRDNLPNRGFPEGGDYEEKVVSFRVSDVRFFRAPGGVYLDYESGMTVLALRRDGRTSYFYLDKPVVLPRGAEFAAIPYQQQCSVRVSVPREQPLEEMEAASPAEKLKITDRIRLGEIYTLFYREEECGFFFKGEQHSMCELTYVDRGQLHCVVDGNGYVLKQGQMILFTPHQWHMQYTDLDLTARFLTITFDLESDLELRMADRVFDLSSEEAVFLRRIVQESTSGDCFSSDMIRGNLKLLLLSVLRTAGGGKKRLKTPLALRNENNLVNRTLQYVADHVYDKLSVESVAREVGVSASHLTALFHRQMNISPGEYIRRIKLEESKYLIREGKMNFSQIAAALKYSTIHHYSRQFKDNFGISPSEYAKSIQNE